MQDSHTVFKTLKQKPLDIPHRSHHVELFHRSSFFLDIKYVFFFTVHKPYKTLPFLSKAETSYTSTTNRYTDSNYGTLKANIFFLIYLLYHSSHSYQTKVIRQKSLLKNLMRKKVIEFVNLR